MLSCHVLHFYQNILRVFELQSGHKIKTIQREITPKARKPELSFVYATCRLVLFYISTKYHKDIPKGIRFTEST